MSESLQSDDGMIKEEDVRDMWDTGNKAIAPLITVTFVV